MPKPSGLYPIIDIDALDRARLAALDFARAVLAARPAIIQLRAKHLSARETLGLLRALRPLARGAQSKLFANDRPDLAKLAGCDGVHLGQGDLPCEEVRRWFPELEVGVSTHSLEQLRSALRWEPDYVAYGPVFDTGNKENPEASVGLASLSQARTLVAGARPLVAIGGIDRGRLAQVRAQADLVAVIGALVTDAPNPAACRERALELKAALEAEPHRA